MSQGKKYRGQSPGKYPKWSFHCPLPWESWAAYSLGINELATYTECCQPGKPIQALGPEFCWGSIMYLCWFPIYLISVPSPTWISTTTSWSKDPILNDFKSHGLGHKAVPSLHTPVELDNLSEMEGKGQTAIWARLKSLAQRCTLLQQ